MSKAEYTIAKQIGNKGYFGRVALDVDTSEANANQVIVDFEDSVSDTWRAAANFGIMYMLDHLPKRSHYPHGLRVHVTTIGGHPVDTTRIVIACAAANALAEALALKRIRGLI